MMKKLVLILLAVVSIVLTACSSGPGAADPLAQCMTDNGAVMYGTEWCPHCANQKKLFDSSFRLVNYVDCDLNRQACNDAGVTGYPTWVFADGSRLSGTQQLYALAESSDCVGAYEEIANFDPDA
jgi:glutaredoxin